MRDHTKLRAFELADEVAFLTYKVTGNFPREEQFGLTSQMRRAAVSIPSNIVEGADANRSLTTFGFWTLPMVHFESLNTKGHWLLV